MRDPRTQIVADGYDAIDETFASWREEIVGDPSFDGVCSFYVFNHVPGNLLTPPARFQWVLGRK